MIDLHCHILPGIDDGAADMAESLALLRLAQQQGISHMVATPHVQSGYYDNTVQSIGAALQSLRASAASEGINVQLAAAAELRVEPQLIQLAERKALPLLGHYQGDKLLLLEFPHSHIPPGSDKLIKYLAKLGYRIMVAHPERNRELQQDPAKIIQLQRLDCLFQLTASSVLGAMGDMPLQVAKQYLADGVFSVVATDCHSLKRRPPLLAQAMAQISSWTSPEMAQQLVQDTPQQISQSLFNAGGMMVAA
ncbi:tyrosine-protein phosphatase [Rheinheimera sp.]|uniref:tyrosine-protein phosphatase n=1 Tax=Rheinheimera sp. TaxID=1869214 RepID=UPI002734260E|nr:CpsB/CapC family capsule biosynthesis tyrosine phosphatase [Rheinheimera sp.]MDP2715758.1 CpsB/CapC family capsule biosynthesis tyrosine phosphatase [Rheinheimera sp.]